MKQPDNNDRLILPQSMIPLFFSGVEKDTIQQSMIPTPHTPQTKFPGIKWLDTRSKMQLHYALECDKKDETCYIPQEELLIDQLGEVGIISSDTYDIYQAIKANRAHDDPSSMGYPLRVSTLYDDQNGVLGEFFSAIAKYIEESPEIKILQHYNMHLDDREITVRETIHHTMIGIEEYTCIIYYDMKPNLHAGICLSPPSGQDLTIPLPLSLEDTHQIIKKIFQKDSLGEILYDVIYQKQAHTIEDLYFHMRS